MPSWYKGTAIQHIRPVGINALTSQLFWENWNHVSAEQLRRIAAEFLRRISLIEPTSHINASIPTALDHPFRISKDRHQMYTGGPLLS